MGKNKDKPYCHDEQACHPPPAYAMATPYLIEWAFIRKVYAIVAMQLLLTVAVAAMVNLVHPIRDFFVARTKAALVACIILISPIIVMTPMIFCRNKHPINLLLLAVFTVCISFTFGLGCLSRNGTVIMEAVVITLWWWWG